LGRNFSSDFTTDSSNSVIVNETFVKEGGLVDPIGKTIKMTENEEGNQMKTIIGVVRDFHFGSLREPIKPIVISMLQAPYGKILVKFQRAKQSEALMALEKVYKAIVPNAVFKYDYLDELNAKQYKQEQRWQKIVNIATILSLIICCFGLLGMAHLSTKRRIKEIGVRKVLGASITHILILMSSNFLRLVIFAFVLAAPIAYFLMKNWLENFAYRTTLSWWAFVMAGVIALIVAILTVSWLSFKAAMANPVESLRDE